MNLFILITYTLRNKDYVKQIFSVNNRKRKRLKPKAYLCLSNMNHRITWYISNTSIYQRRVINSKFRVMRTDKVNKLLE